MVLLASSMAILVLRGTELSYDDDTMRFATPKWWRKNVRLQLAD